MEFTVGTLLEGKVKSITKFGAFILLPENRTGMVHISEVANTYVSDIRAHLTEGDVVRVKIIGIDESGKISLSIKRAQKAEREGANAKKDIAKAGGFAGADALSEAALASMDALCTQLENMEVYENAAD